MDLKRIITYLVLISLTLNAEAQFAPAAGETGTTAIYKDDPAFVAWAKSCQVKRGFINIADTTKTFTQDQKTSNRAFFGNEAVATGVPGGALDCISLGDSGTAVLTFDFPIRNGSGFDFAVFENGIKEQEAPFQYFLELAFVEVSTDGKRFVRFSATSNTPVDNQIASFGQIDPTQINNFAGKYVANYGTPFDLNELADSTGINLDSINYIRLVDVVGSTDPKYASHDATGNIVNDPFPTEFWSGGFDLDAVGAIYLNGITGIKNELVIDNLRIFPNPLKEDDLLTIEIPNSGNTEIELWTVSGRKLSSWQTKESDIHLELPATRSGLYLLKLKFDNEVKTVKLMVQ
jgi:hypothetical protein